MDANGDKETKTEKKQRAAAQESMEYTNIADGINTDEKIDGNVSHSLKNIKNLNVREICERVAIKWKFKKSLKLAAQEFWLKFYRYCWSKFFAVPVP